MVSLLDMAVKKTMETPEDGHLLSDRKTLVFAGSKGAGKTTMIQRFLEKTEPVKETLALDYCYARKSGRSLTKDVCHIWELGGSSLFSPLLPTVFGLNLQYTTLILALDLSSPQTLWLTLENILQVVYSHVTKIKDADLEKSTHELPPDHEDKAKISPFPVPLVIIGAKYDLFVNMDPEAKKIITRCLRLVAHSLGASLIYYSDHDSALVKRLKDVLNHYGFGAAQWKGYSSDLDKPICIPCGADSFQQISTLVVPSSGISGLALDRFKHAFTDQFPQDKEVTALPDDPAADPNFKEPVIDNLRSQKDEELDRLNREKESRAGISLKTYA